MTSKTIKKLVDSYEYNGLGFPVILRDVPIVEDRGYEYPLINYKDVMNKAAYNLVIKHESLDGARLKFLRRFIGLSLDQMAELTGVSKSTLHKWEKTAGKPLDISGEKLRLIFMRVRDVISKEISEKLDSAIVQDIVKQKKIAPLELSGDPVAV